MPNIPIQSFFSSELGALKNYIDKKHPNKYYSAAESVDFISKIFDLSSAVPIAESNKTSPKLRIKNSSPHAIFAYGVVSQELQLSEMTPLYHGARLPVITSPFTIFPGDEAVYDFSPVPVKEAIVVTMRFMITKDTLKKPYIHKDTPVVYFDIVFETGWLRNNIISTNEYFFWLRYLYASARTFSEKEYIKLIPGVVDERCLKKVEMKKDDDFSFIWISGNDAMFNKDFPEFGLAFNNYIFDKNHNVNSFIEFV